MRKMRAAVTFVLLLGKIRVALHMYGDSRQQKAFPRSVYMAGYVFSIYTGVFQRGSHHALATHKNTHLPKVYVLVPAPLVSIHNPVQIT